MKRSFGLILILVIVVGAGAGVGVGYWQNAGHESTAQASGSQNGQAQRGVAATPTAAQSSGGAQASGTPQAGATPRAVAGGAARTQTTPGAATAGGTLRAAAANTGVIERVDGDIVTIRTATGSVRVKISDDTAIRKSIAGTMDDLKAGETVTVAGPAGADGVVAATAIQALSPELRAGQP